MRTRLFINVAMGFGLIFSVSTWAEPCDTHLMTSEQAIARVHEVAARNPGAKHLEELLTVYDQVAAKMPEIQNLFPALEVQRLAADGILNYYPKVLITILQAMAADAQAKDLSAKLTAAATVALHNHVPAHSIPQRIQDFLAKKPNSLRRLLGDMERAEVHELLYGRDLKNPSPESLLGQYLKETGATTLMRSFNITPTNQTQGPQRLVVSVSKESFAAFNKYFARLEFVSVFGHAYMLQNGVINSYAHRYAEMREQTAGHILPWITLKTTEGQRLDNYFRALSMVGMNGWNHPLMTPWDAGYCDPSAWITCTQWIGNVPIGDQLVDTWTLPGKIVDGKPVVNTANGDANSNPPLVTKLKAHNMAEPALQEIFTVPGRMQLSEVLGQLHTNAAGEFANPGWVVQTLIGPIAQEFVPVVFLWAEDHKKPIDPNFVPQFEAPH